MLQTETLDLLNPLNHEVFIKNLQKKVEATKSEISTLNQQIIESTSQVESLKSENGSLKKKLGYYREMVAELKLKNRHPVFRSASKQSEYEDEDFDMLERKYEIFEELVLHEYKNSEMLKVDDPEKVLDQNYEVSNIVLFVEKLNKLLNKLISCNSLNGMMTELEEILKQILH